MIKIDYKTTLNNIRRYLKSTNSDFINNEEFDAGISHWLDNREHQYPFIDDRTFYDLEQFDFIEQSKHFISNDNKISEPSSPFQACFEFLYENIPFPTLPNSKFTFIDLFAGIGGFRLAFQGLGGKCVFSSEWDKYAKKTYEMNFGEVPYGDITKIDENDIPNHDILCGGFPCQAFSIAGHRQGFDDTKGRGNLFFDILRIISKKQPKAFFLENVKNLESHDNGNTFKIICEKLENLGYKLYHKVLNSCEYGNVPQNRERIYLIGIKDNNKEFIWPKKTKRDKGIRDVIEKNVDEKYYYYKYKCYSELEKSVNSIDSVYQWRRKYVRENKKGLCPTLTANMGTGGHNVPIILDGKSKNKKIGNIRKLTPIECARLQGYPDNYKLPETLSNATLYKQFGNTVTVSVIKQIAKELIKCMEV